MPSVIIECASTNGAMSSALSADLRIAVTDSAKMARLSSSKGHAVRAVDGRPDWSS